MSVVDPTKWADAVQRGQLTPEEEAQLQAYLAQHPDQRTRWEEELALNQVLGHLPDAPLASNFTARVLRAVEQSAPAPVQEEVSGWHRLVHGWLPKWAGALALVSIGLFSYHQHQQSVLRKEVAASVAEFAKLTSGGAIDVLQNFDAIARLDQLPGETDRQLARDRELIAALK